MQISISNSIGGGGGAKGGGSTPAFSNVYSFDYDGVDDKFASDNNYTELNGSTNASISFWIKPLDSSNAFIWRFGKTVGNQRLGCVWRPNGMIDLSVNTGSYFFRTAAGVVPLNQWTHICWTFDGSLSRYSKTNIYVNGVRSVSANTGAIVSSLDFNALLEIGGSGSSFGNFKLDEMSVWNNTTLTESQSLEIYNSGEPNDLNSLASGTPNPTTWLRQGDSSTWNGTKWTMNDVNGSTVLSSSNMIEANRTTDVPTASSFTNTLSTSFDGVDDFVNMGDVLDFERTSAFSISAWIKRGGTGVNDTVVSKMESSGNFRGYLLFISSTNLVKFVLRNVNTSSNRLFVDSTSTITDTNWHHILMTYDGSSSVSGVKIYIDGISDTVTTAGTLSATTLNSSPFNIGARNSNSLFATATIDETAIFNVELSASAVTSIYNSGTPTDLTSYSPVSWWRMGDGSTFPTINDEIGSNNGTMNNMSASNFVADVPTASSFTNTLSTLFDGVDDSVSMASNINLGTNASFSFWMKRNNTALNVPFGFGTNWYEFLVRLRSTQVEFSNGGVYINATTLSAINQTTDWTHLLFVRTGATCNLYVNGVNNDGAKTVNNPATDVLFRRIGTSGDGTTWAFSGLIDEVSVYNTALSPSDATAIYNGGVPTDLTSFAPLGWFRMGDGSTFPTINDIGSGGSNGTMNNMSASNFVTDVPI